MQDFKSINMEIPPAQNILSFGVECLFPKTVFLKNWCLSHAHPTFTCSKSTIETPEHCVKSVQH